MNHTAPLASNNAEPHCAKRGNLTSFKVLVPSVKRDYEERLFECPACSYAETVFIKL
jgi:hypothetical protein